MHNQLVDLYKLNDSPITKDDVDTILFIGDKKVAIVSEGDIAENLRNKLQKKKAENPNIIIICLRSADRQNSSLRMMIEEESDLYKDRIEAWTSFSNIVDMREPLDNAVACVIVKKIVELLK